jgi:hypothetical protein
MVPTRGQLAECGTRRELERTRKCCANCLYSTRPCGRWLRIILSRFAGLLLCANSAAAPGELRGVAPCTVCPNFRPRRPPMMRTVPPPPPDDSVRYIPLTQGYYAIVDAEDYERVSRYKWCLMIRGSKAYAMRTERGKTILMHREIMKPPKGMVVDHINGNGLDNRRCNLRACTVLQNAWNRKPAKGSSSPYLGVYRRKSRPDKWYVKVQGDGEVTNLGPFDSELEAARARDYRAVEVHGPYAHVNLPDEWPPERRAAVMEAARLRAGTPECPGAQSGRVGS